MRNPNRHGSWIIILVLSLWSFSFAQNPPEIRGLERGKPIERELAGGEVHAYSIKLTVGQFLSVIVDQRGIDVVVTLFAPDGKQVAEVDSGNGANGPEPVVVVAETSGSYRLVVRSFDQKAASGRYEVRMETLRAATSEDKKLAAAVSLALKTRDLATALVFSQTEAERAALLVREKELITVDLRRALVSRGIRFENQQNYAQSLLAFRLALGVAEQIGDKTGMAMALHFLGWVSSRQANYALAMDYYRKSLALKEPLGDNSEIASTLVLIAVVHNAQGNYSEALEYFQRSLRMVEPLGKKSFVPVPRILANIGAVLHRQGNYASAMDYHQRSLKLYYESDSPTKEWAIADILGNIGRTHRAQNNYDQAMEFYQKSLTINEKLGNKFLIAALLGNIGEINYLKGNYEQALEFAKRGTALARQIGTPEYLWRGLTLEGRAYHALNQPTQARQAFEEAVLTVERLRTNVIGQESRASYFATLQQPYELYIDLLMHMHKQHPVNGHDALALQVTERARARSLLEALSEARADIRQGVDPTLLQRERTLQQQLNAAAARQTMLLTNMHTEKQATAVSKEINALTAESQDVQTQIRQRSPRYAALTQPVPLSLQEIQTKVLDKDTLLLEYALGEDRSYLWAVTPTSITSFELPKRAEIEAAVRRAVTMLSDGKQWATSNRIQAEYTEVAGRLSQILLVPVAAQLKGKRLLIVGDGALQYLPFGALPTPQSQESGVVSLKSQTKNKTRRRNADSRLKTADSRLPLIVEHEIVSLPSASTLAILRRETANRTRPTKSIAVLADPVFEREDERVSVAATGNQTVSKAGASSASKDTNSELTHSRYLLERAFGLGLQPATAEDGASRGILRIPRLPFTRREADAILAIAPAGEGLKALDFRASRETATNPELAQYRIVHFATHGLLNSEHPELSGIVLSLVNEAGQTVDGFLRLHEIYNLQLNADMVVLSACQTGLGKEIRGEGLVGLTRGFMYAGAPRVVASLWKVDDVATAELMKRFYRGMLKDNLRPAAALRRAKVEMWKQKRWNAPFYWAAFELQGEWK